MKEILLLTLFISQPAFCWIIKNQEGKCSDGGESFSPESYLNSSLAKCTKVSEGKLKTVLNCKARVAAMDGITSFYQSMEDCKKDGGIHDSKKSQMVKEKWKKNYDSKLWSLTKLSCPKTETDCSQSAVKTNEFIQTMKPVYEGKGYNCASTFDVILNTETPPDSFKMSFICMNPTDICTSSVFWFETEKECREFKKESK